MTRWDDGGGSGGRRPLAVVLHGAPGGYGDFSENLVPRLCAAGVDVLVPNFPGESLRLLEGGASISHEQRPSPEL